MNPPQSNTRFGFVIIGILTTFSIAGGVYLAKLGYSDANILLTAATGGIGGIIGAISQRAQQPDAPVPPKP